MDVDKVHNEGVSLMRITVQLFNSMYDTTQR
jgi:hypothetical protein